MATSISILTKTSSGWGRCVERMPAHARDKRSVLEQRKDVSTMKRIWLIVIATLLLIAGTSLARWFFFPQPDFRDTARADLNRAFGALILASTELGGPEKRPFSFDQLLQKGTSDQAIETFRGTAVRQPLLICPEASLWQNGTASNQITICFPVPSRGVNG